ncbi:MAG: hypothetical protein ACRDJ9_26725, partial [Dehalococcoidia bacterium]
VPPRVSIVTRGGSGAQSFWSFSRDREIFTKRELMAQLIVLLGGRAAEMNTFGEPSTRAEDDLDDAARLARLMVERWAMTGRLELAGRDPDPVTRSRTESRSEPAVAKLLARSEVAARTILADNADRLAAIARELVCRETLAIAQVAHVAGLPQPHSLVIDVDGSPAALPPPGGGRGTSPPRWQGSPSPWPTLPGTRHRRE